MTDRYNWTDNPTRAQISEYNPDTLNECLMHLKYDNVPGKNTAYCFNSGNLDASGKADLVEAELSTDLVFSQSGTYTINIPTSGNYDVVLVGGGAGGAWGYDVYGVKSTSSGGSGAVFIGNIYIPAGNYSCKVGGGGAAAGNGGTGGAGGDTSIGTLISAGGGSGTAYATWGTRRQSTGGEISCNTTINSSTINSNGNNGTTAINSASTGGASLWNALGKGGDATLDESFKGGEGFLSIRFNGASFINYKVGGTYRVLKGSLSEDEHFTLNGLNSDNATSLSDGTYNKFVGADGSSELLKNTIFRQPRTPYASTNDVWFNTSVSPFSVRKYDGSSWVAYDKIPLASITVADGQITSYYSFPYNQNGFNANMQSPVGFASDRIINIYNNTQSNPDSNVPLIASGTSYFAPDNGYYIAQRNPVSENSYLRMQVASQSGAIKYVDIDRYTSALSTLYCIAKVQKGDKMTLYYSGTSTYQYLRFIYAEGCY